MAHPAHDAKAMDKAVRWAISSATSSDLPCLTLFVLPKWSATSYNKCLFHPFVHDLVTTPARGNQQMQLSKPDAWTGVKSQWEDRPFRRQYRIFCVANPAGIKSFYKHEAFVAAYTIACNEFLGVTSHKPCILHPRFKDARLRINTPLICQRFSDPRKFRSAVPAPPNPHASPCSSPVFTTTQLEAEFPTTFALKHDWQSFVYTDGSCIPASTGNEARGNMLGAAFYDGPSGKTIMVEPQGCGSTNTITRAELSALDAAIDHCCLTPNKLHILTDSLSSIHMIRRMVHYPLTQLESSHFHLLTSIMGNLGRRAAAGLATCIGKVKSHIGIRGNELADTGAGEVAKGAEPDTYTTAMNNSCDHLPCWPIAMNTEPKQSLSNLNSAVLACTMSSSSGGNMPHTKMTTRWEATTSISEPGVADLMWGSNVSFPTLRNAIILGYNLLYTSATALRWGTPYMTRKDGSHVPGYRPLFVTDNGHCPLCPEMDGTNHVLGGCCNTLMSARFTARHNAAMMQIYKAFLQGSIGACYTVLDVTSQTDLPPGVSGNRLPEWILPSLKNKDRLRMRPDMLVVEGLYENEVQKMVRGSTFHRKKKRECVIHIIEVGYCSDSGHAQKLQDKHAQHSKLLTALRQEGWTVHDNRVSVILLGTVGTIFQPCSDILKSLKIPAHIVKLTLRTLSIHAVKTAHSIVLARRALERPTPDPQPPRPP